jgi:group II intron reverse transcriptase/maturase
MALREIAEQARDKQRVFTTLAHLIDMELLREAFRRLRKEASPGIDGQTKASYAEDLESNLADLHERLRTRRYRATPARRAWVPKDDGSERPIAILILEDKIVQRAVAMLLEPIYERDFYDFSYGFRRGRRSQHDALRSLRERIMELKGVWLVDADIRGYFDQVPRAQLQEILSRRVNDGGIRRLIGKWLRVGIQEGDQLFHPGNGVPQGGVISPLLSNIYLHTVLDEWYAEEVQPRLEGRSFMVRFADDFVIGCETRGDAERLMEVLPKRLSRFGLELHPQKTRLVQFTRPPLHSDRPHGNGTFDLLGFTHYWARSRRGNWVVKRRKAKGRQRQSQNAIATWCKRNRHMPLAKQHQALSLKLIGHYNYYGLRTNFQQLRRMYRHTRHQWRRWLSTRNRKGRLSWEQFERKTRRFPLPTPRIVHDEAQLSFAG